MIIMTDIASMRVVPGSAMRNMTPVSLLPRIATPHQVREMFLWPWSKAWDILRSQRPGVGGVIATLFWNQITGQTTTSSYRSLSSCRNSLSLSLSAQHSRSRLVHVRHPHPSQWQPPSWLNPHRQKAGTEPAAGQAHWPDLPCQQAALPLRWQPC